MKYRVWNVRRFMKENEVAILGNGNLLFLEHGTDNEYSEMNELNVKVSRFTGLKDNDGQEIFEGDIAIHDGKSGSLVSKPYGIPRKYGNGETFIFSYIKCGLVARHISAFGDSMYDTPNCIINGWEPIDAYQLWNLHRGFKIIGNIYENPELLELARSDPRSAEQS